MSESINSVVISGNLTRDPELRQAGQTPALSMRVAVNERRKNAQTGAWEDAANYVGATLFGARAEALAHVLAKGSRVTVQGRLRWHEWQDKDGGRCEALDVVADRVDLPPRARGEGQGAQGCQAAPAYQTAPYRPATAYQAAAAAQPAQYDPGLQAAVASAMSAQYAPAAVYDEEIPF